MSRPPNGIHTCFPWKVLLGRRQLELHVDGVTMHVPLNSAPISGLLKGPSVVIIARHGLDPNRRSAP